MKLLLIVMCLFVVNLLSFAEDIEHKVLLEIQYNGEVFVGESYPYQLTIYPADPIDVGQEVKAGKNLFDKYFISNVKAIKRSENNYDVVHVELDLILASLEKNDWVSKVVFNNKQYEITWPRNNFVDVKLLKKDFSVFNTGPVEFIKDRKWWQYLIIVVILVALLSFILKKIVKKNRKIERSFDLVKIKNPQSHEDLEYIYRYRRDFLESLNNEFLVRKYNDLLLQYGNMQFKENWKSLKIDEFKSKLIELGKEIDSGI